MWKISENIRYILKKIQGTLRSEKGNCARQLYIGICHAQASAREKFRHATSVCLPIPKSSRTPPASSTTTQEAAMASGALKRFIPMLDRILVQRAEAVTKSKGGILIPEKAQSKVR